MPRIGQPGEMRALIESASSSATTSADQEVEAVGSFGRLRAVHGRAGR